MRTYLAMLFLVIGSVAIDQVTKSQARENLLLWESESNTRNYHSKRVPVWSSGDETPVSGNPEFFLSFSFNYVRNQGAAWGVLSDLDDSIRDPFFFIITFFAVIVIIFYFRSTPSHHRLVRFALGLVLSGAIGNFLDRLKQGYVVDFLDFRWVIPLPFENFPAWRYAFPNFNWADSMITIGVACLLFDMLFLESKRKRNETQSTYPQAESKVSHSPSDN